MIVTIVRLYDHHTDAANAVSALRQAGIPEQDISILTRDERVHGAAAGAGVGAALGGLAGLLTGLGLVSIPGVGPVAAAGWFAATVTGAAAGGWAGGAVGVLMETGISGEEAHAISECLRRGATMVTARVPEVDKNRYIAILDCGAIDLQVRVAAYRRVGWVSYNPDADPYTEEEIQRERERNRNP